MRSSKGPLSIRPLTRGSEARDSKLARNAGVRVSSDSMNGSRYLSESKRPTSSRFAGRVLSLIVELEALIVELGALIVELGALIV